MGYAAARARQEQRRAAGTLPGAKGTGTRAEVPAKAARVPLATCAHLGARVSAACGELARLCTLHGTTTSAFTKCASAARFCPECPDFATDQAAPVPLDPRNG